MDLGKKIQELRKKENLSQEQLAEKMNVTRQTISKWELNETTPDIKQAKELSKLFKISLDELTEIILKMAYVMIEEADSTQVKSYEEFLKSIDNIYSNTDWINTIVEVATSPISRGV